MLTPTDRKSWIFVLERQHPSHLLTYNSSSVFKSPLIRHASLPPPSLEGFSQNPKTIFATIFIEKVDELVEVLCGKKEAYTTIG
jgi:hypothetical protein